MVYILVNSPSRPVRYTKSVNLAALSVSVTRMGKSEFFGVKVAFLRKYPT